MFLPPILIGATTNVAPTSKLNSALPKLVFNIYNIKIGGIRFM